MNMVPLVKSSRDIILRTRNWLEALRFYEGTLGFKVIYRKDPFGLVFNLGQQGSAAS